MSWIQEEYLDLGSFNYLFIASASLMLLYLLKKMSG